MAVASPGFRPSRKTNGSCTTRTTSVSSAANTGTGWVRWPDVSSSSSRKLPRPPDGRKSRPGSVTPPGHMSPETSLTSPGFDRYLRSEHGQPDRCLGGVREFVGTVLGDGGEHHIAVGSQLG